MRTTATPRAIEAAAGLQRLMRQSLEIMCFAEAELLPPLLHLEPLRDMTVAAEVEFSGSHSGHLAIETGPATARALTAAFLGLDLSHPSLSAHAPGVLEELAGTVCGRLVASLDPTARFQMSIPSTHLAVSGRDDYKDTIEQVFRLSSGALRVTLRLA
jgi:Chemotaxis phosphatase CheX